MDTPFGSFYICIQIYIVHTKAQRNTQHKQRAPATESNFMGGLQLLLQLSCHVSPVALQRAYRYTG